MNVFLTVEFLSIVTGYLISSCFASCNVTLHATTRSQNFTSPNYPQNYNNNEVCYWDLFPSTNGYNIVLDMVYFNIEGSPSYCSYDNLSIYNMRTKELIRKICGTRRWDMNIGGGDPVKIIFRTDSSDTRQGFVIRYYETPDTSNCGGTLTATSMEQTFNSPGYPNTYYLQQSCTWTITAQNTSHVIKLETLRSSIEKASSGYCPDYVTVTDADGTTLGLFCGSDLPVFVSAGNTVKVHFTSDSSQDKKGFLMKYTSMPASNCNVSFPASEHRLTIVTPGYRGSYHNNLICVWTIYSTNSQQPPVIQVDINRRDVQHITDCTSDGFGVSLQYTNGSETTETVCNSLSSTLHYQVKGNITVTFTGVDQGFSVQYQMKAIDGCGTGFLTAGTERQYLKSPYYPNAYRSNTNCTWTIEASGGNRVKIQVMSSSLEYTYGRSRCSADYVTAYDGRSVSSPILGKWCGTTRPQYISSGQYMTLVFHSDSSNNYQGFNIAYSQVNGTVPGCGNTNLIATSYGRYLTSPGYPNNYQNDVSCTWTLEAPSGHLQVDIIDMNIESSSMSSSRSCTYDYLAFYDGSSSYQPVMAKYCGSVPKSLHSSGRYMTIVFHTDNSFVKNGFRLRYTAASTSATDQCGVTSLTAYSSSLGYLQSPGYPGNYPLNLDCQWTISASTGHIVEVDILFLQMEYSTLCVSDYLAFYDGSVSSLTSLGKVCGQLSAARTHFSTDGSSVVIQFHSDSSDTDSGFRLQFKASDSLGCNRNIDVSVLEFTTVNSPHYPASYGNNEDCYWLIHADYPFVVDLEVFTSDVERSSDCTYDYVEAFDGQDDTAVSLGRWCGTSRPHKHSTGQYMYVTFHSDDSETRSGFQLDFTAKSLSDYDDSHVNIGGIVGGIAGALVVLVLVACCVSTTRKRPRGTSNDITNSNNINNIRRRTCGRHVANPNPHSVYAISPGNYPMSVRPQPATFTPPPPYSEVIKDGPPPYTEAVSVPDPQPIIQRGAQAVCTDSDANQGIDNHAGPQHGEGEPMQS